MAPLDRRALLALAIAVAACGDARARRAPAADAQVHAHAHDAAAPLDGAPVPDADPPHHADAHDVPAADGGEPADAGHYTGPARLSETGLYADTARRTLAPGVIAYDVAWPLWADGAGKDRFLWLPPGTRIDASDADHWRFPVGTRAFKAFQVGDRVLETRLLEKTEEGWRMAAYVWNEAGDEAFARPMGEVDASGTSHDVPSSEGCAKCHRGAADGILGVAAIQLGATGVAALVRAGLLDAQPPRSYDVPGTGAAREALGYLHGNCAHCHNDVHPLSRFERLRLVVPVGASTPEDTPAYRTAIGLMSRHDVGGTTVVVVPGQPAASQLLARMRTRAADQQMPPLGSERPDDAAIAVVEAWIAALAP